MKSKVPVDKILLSNLKVGDVAKIVSIENENIFFRRRLIEMGLTKGVVVEIKKVAPLGDPVGIKLRGYELCLRKCEMKNIGVEVLK